MSSPRCSDPGSGARDWSGSWRTGVTLCGFAGLWWGSERAWGMFSRSRDIGA